MFDEVIVHSDKLKKVKSTFDYDSEDGKELAKRFAKSNGLSVNELLNTLLRRAIFSSIVNLYPEDQHDEMIAKLNLAFPDPKNLSTRAFMGNFDGLGTSKSGLKLYTHDNFMEIWKVMNKSLPCGRWEPVKLGDPNAPAGAVYLDQAGNYFDIHFNSWHKRIKSFGSWNGHLNLINQALDSDSWEPNSPDDYFWDIHIGLQTLKAVLFDRNGKSRGWKKGMKKLVYENMAKMSNSEGEMDIDSLITLVYGDENQSSTSELIQSNFEVDDFLSESDDETAVLLRQIKENQ